MNSDAEINYAAACGRVFARIHLDQHAKIRQVDAISCAVRPQNMSAYLSRVGVDLSHIAIPVPPAGYYNTQATCNAFWDAYYAIAHAHPDWPKWAVKAKPEPKPDTARRRRYYLTLTRAQHEKLLRMGATEFVAGALDRLDER